jgi:hypothetical protein
MAKPLSHFSPVFANQRCASQERIATCSDVTRLTPHGWKRYLLAQVQAREQERLVQILAQPQWPVCRAASPSEIRPTAKSRWG